MITIYRPDRTIPLPKRAHHNDAGIDLPSAENVTLNPGQRQLISTGIYLGLPKETVGLICPRSGLAVKKGLSIVNAPGVIDEGYRGEIKVCLINLDSENPIKIARGDRIAQLLVQKIKYDEVIEIRQSDWEEECRFIAAKQDQEKRMDNFYRNKNGFGSTG